MKKLTTLLLAGIVLVSSGCGVNKDYVAEQISASEAKTNSELATLRDKTDGNAAEVAKLISLSNELSSKTDMAINKAKGFENYQIIWQGDITFDFDSYAINANSEQLLIDAGEKMEQVPGSVVEIAGHTDGTGSSNYNFMLGEQRAKSAQRYLSDRFGISLYRMFTVSYGKNKPMSASGENQAASKNRRVSLTIWGNLE